VVHVAKFWRHISSVIFCSGNGGARRSNVHLGAILATVALVNETSLHGEPTEIKCSNRFSKQNHASCGRSCYTKGYHLHSAQNRGCARVCIR
jgi:hypothetical protein